MKQRGEEVHSSVGHTWEGSIWGAVKAPQLKIPPAFSGLLCLESHTGDVFLHLLTLEYVDFSSCSMEIFDQSLYCTRVATTSKIRSCPVGPHIPSAPDRKIKFPNIYP